MKGTDSIEQYAARTKTLVKDCVYQNPDEIGTSSSSALTQTRQMRDSAMNTGD